MKWILVTCFGYVGYKNACFGKVAVHIAVCAFGREALLKTVRMAEERDSEQTNRKRYEDGRQRIIGADFETSDILNGTATVFSAWGTAATVKPTKK